MISKLRPLMVLGLGPTLEVKNYDKPPKNYYYPKNDSEDGWERIKRMCRADEYGRMSSELNSIYQSGFLGMFIGGVYGGFLGSRDAYFNFLDRNQATAFRTHLDAKRKLQDQVTMGFAKNAFRFGWRLALFTTSITAITTTVSVYRGKSSMYEYIIAGATTGAMYKFNLGLRGIAAGTIVGGVLGTLGGAVSLLLLKSTGTTMEEVRYWQYKWRSNRDENINEGFKTQIKGTERDDPLISQHDEKPQVGNDKLDLKILIPDEPAKEDKVASKKT